LLLTKFGKLKRIVRDPIVSVLAGEVGVIPKSNEEVDSIPRVGGYLHNAIDALVPHVVESLPNEHAASSAADVSRDSKYCSVSGVIGSRASRKALPYESKSAGFFAVTTRHIKSNASASTFGSPH
jgi:hypothetical protein